MKTNLNPVFRVLSLALVVLLALLPGMACSKEETKDGKSDSSASSGEGASARTGLKTFRYINRGDVITLDLNQVSYLQDFRVLYAIREGLYSYDPKTLKAVPALVTSAETSADKRTWTFKLRPEAKWSNGDPVVAGDFVFSWRLMLENPGEYTYLYYYIKGAKQYEADYAAAKKPDFATVGVKAADDHTLVVELENPVLFLTDLLAFPPFYPRHAKSMEPFREEKNGRVSYRDEYTRPPAVVTNGPFRLTEWELKRRLRFEKDQNYWNKDAVMSDALEMVVNNDYLSAFQQYDAGEVDWLADVQPNIAVDLKETGRKDLRVGPGFGTFFLTLNTRERVPGVPAIAQKNPLADVRVRQALALAIDKQAIVDTITRMGERPALHYVPPGIFEGYDPRGGLAMNVERAKALLAEAGYPGGSGFPTLPIIYNTDNKTREQIAQMLRSQWQRNLGISVEVQGLELSGGYRPAIKDKNYAIGLAAWFGDYTDPSTFTDKYLSTSQNNDSDWRNPEFDALLAEAARETDIPKRLDMLMRAEEMINQQVPIVPLYHAVNYSLYRDNVKGLVINPKQLISWQGIHVER